LLGNTDLKDEGLLKLQQAYVKTVTHHKITGLKLEANDIHNVDYLSPMLTLSTSTITFIDLRWNQLGAEGKVSEMSKFSHLFHYSFLAFLKKKGTAKLANCLKSNKILQSLNLEGNEVAVGGAKVNVKTKKQNFF
jgi:hypothetical protein